MFEFLSRKYGDPTHKIDRLASIDVTDTIARAMEHADEMKTVVILYETKDGVGYPGGVIMQKDSTSSQVNWMLDLAKKSIVE